MSDHEKCVRKWHFEGFQGDVLQQSSSHSNLLQPQQSSPATKAITCGFIVKSNKNLRRILEVLDGEGDVGRLVGRRSDSGFLKFDGDLRNWLHLR
jgi:hypothetical protein